MHSSVLRRLAGFAAFTLIAVPRLCASFLPNILPPHPHTYVYTADKQTPLSLDVYTPSNEHTAPWPVVVYIHGGGFNSGSRTGARNYPVSGELVKRGYAVASIDYRLDPEFKFPSQIEDAACAVRYIRAHATDLNIDPNRIGAFGESAGGFLVALLESLDPSSELLGTRGWGYQSSRIQAAAILYSACDLPMAYDFGKAEQKAIGLAFGTEPGILQQASALKYVSKNTPPTLVLH